jgi:putative dimethyl sulfoxide reductase chaperone
MRAALAESAARRSRTYWLLARLVLDRPGAALLAELDSTLPPAAEAAAKDEPLADEVGRLGAAVRVALGDPKAFAALEVDYTRLFAGLAERYGAPAPFESVVLESRVMGDSTLAVEAAYREAGFDAPIPEAGPPDHLGAELHFLSLACYREMEAWQAGDSAAAAGWVERERRFLDEHLLAWVPRHCERLAQVAETPFYRAVVSLIGRACLVDREDVTLLLDQTAT